MSPRRRRQADQLPAAEPSLATRGGLTVSSSLIAAAVASAALLAVLVATRHNNAAMATGRNDGVAIALFEREQAARSQLVAVIRLTLHLPLPVCCTVGTKLSPPPLDLQLLFSAGYSHSSQPTRAAAIQREREPTACLRLCSR